jgi:hypothetical protein
VASKPKKSAASRAAKSGNAPDEEEQGAVALAEAPEEEALDPEPEEERAPEPALPEGEFEMLDPIVPKEPEDYARIIKRVGALRHSDALRDHFRFIAINNPLHKVRLLEERIIPRNPMDPRSEDTTVPAVWAEFRRDVPDARLKDAQNNVYTYGVFDILAMDKVNAGELDPFYVKALFESPKNESFRKRTIPFSEARKIVDARVKAVLAAEEANKMASESMNPRIAKTGHLGSLDELNREMAEARRKKAQASAGV